MPAIIGKEQIEEIRTRNDIVEVLGTYLQLQRAGSAFKALCPFHKEKTPSFHVNPQRQIFHCFGCDKGGDVFRFLMDYEGVDFPTAARMLAERSGVRIQAEESAEPRGPSKAQLYEVMHQAALFYQRVLLQHSSGAGARDYLAGRRLDAEVIEQFTIGYAPRATGALPRWAQKRGFPEPLLIACGLLASQEGGRTYSRFRGRVMFPIHDEIGRVIGFSGRILDPTESPAKYVNSPETPLFRKNRVLFAMDKARRDILDVRRAVLCEGQIDVIRCHAAGITQAVAAQGTALTENHARLLGRYADSVVLVMDADTAGQAAAIRAGQTLMAAGLSVRVAALPPGEDPDSLILGQGADAFRGLLEAAQPLVAYQIGVLSEAADADTEAGYDRLVRAVVETMSHAPNAARREQLVRTAAELLKRPGQHTVTEVALHDDLTRLLRRGRGRRRPAEAGEPETARRSHPPEEIALLEAMRSEPEAADLVRKYVPLETMADADCRRLARRLLEAGDLSSFQQAGSTEEGSALQQLAVRIEMAPGRAGGDDAGPLRVAQDSILVIRRKAVERQHAELRQRLTQMPEGPERDRLDAESNQAKLDIYHLRQGWDQALPLLDLEA